MLRLHLIDGGTVTFDNLIDLFDFIQERHGL